MNKPLIFRRIDCPVKLRINGKTVAKARATSKKKAEEKVSKRAYFALQDKINKIT